MAPGTAAAGRFIRELEQRLLLPETRASAAALRHLLAEEFIEFGSSGRVYDREMIVSKLAGQEPTWRYQLSDFAALELGPGLILATYRTRATAIETGQQRCSLRSSIWRRHEDGWQMLFHQGTPTAC